MPNKLQKIVRWVERHGYWNPWNLNSSWFDSHSRNRFVDKLHRQLLQIVCTSKPTRQRIAAISLEDERFQLSSTTPPKLDVVVVAHPKDFVTLPVTIASLVLNCENPIRQFMIYVPEFALEEATNISRDLSATYQQDIYVISERTLVPEATMHMIQEKFGERSGWLLQQVLKLESVLIGDETAKLVIDADTSIVSRQLFLDREGRQILHVSSECQDSYYTFLSGLADLPSPFYTHVSHHMVMQRDILNEIMLQLGLASTDELLKRAIKFCRSNSNLTVSLDYEFYGQFARVFAPDRIKLSRLSNLAVRDLPANQKALGRLIAISSRHFKSLSFHAYLRQIVD